MFRWAMILLFFGINKNVSAVSDTALLIELVGTSQQALRATADLIEVESKTLDKIEEAQMVVEEKHNRVMEAKYLVESAANLSQNMNNVNDVNEYTNKVYEVNNFKDSAKSYAQTLKLNKKREKKSNKVVDKTVKDSIKLKKHKDKINIKKYTGNNSATKANIDSARNTSYIVDQGANTNVILSQIYTQNLSKEQIKELKEKRNLSKVEGNLRSMGIISKKRRKKESVSKVVDKALKEQEKI